LDIEIGSYTFKDYFRKIEKDNIFDLLINTDIFVLDLVYDNFFYKNEN